MRYQRFVGMGASMMAAAALVAAPGASQAASDKVESTTDKVEQKMDKAGDAVKGTAKEAKTDMSDSWLTAKTKMALFADERVKGRQISVETVKGTVMLRGKVDSAEAKSAAESIAKGIDGVHGVKNDLQVVAASERPMVDANDKDIQKAVEDSLAKDSRLKKVDVRADKGIVTLTGEADSIGTSARASEIARHVPGVRAVKNEMTYKERSTSMRDVDRSRDTMRSASRDSRVTGAAYGGRQEQVRVMQEALKKEGHDPGPVDGVMGPQTTAAIEAYQKSENLPVTGRADAETLGKLGVSGTSALSPKRRQTP